MGYIMNLRKYVGHEPLIGLGATTMVFNDKNEILFTSIVFFSRALRFKK